ncbi:protein GVQW3-like [Hyposmocoma kahamanoa]|uniref:protein GVQW3-like n=1 Tax=Hyposmocoma kahamanoa TaxID=1477025 RepID=UPI000E6D61F3|nr:protein GVQW3-like [Hyposmocoma kahamanoa]
MVAVYQDSALSLSTIQKWSSEFKRGRESIEDDPRAGGPVSATSKENVKIVEKLVLEDARIRVKTLAEKTKLSVCTIHTILHEYLNFSKISARRVPRMLTPLQKQVRVECSKGFLELCSENPSGIFERIVTGDETCVHHYDPESKQESMQWHKKGTDPPKKFKVCPSAGKLMATVFWDFKGFY